MTGAEAATSGIKADMGKKGTGKCMNQMKNVEQKSSLY